MKLWVLPLTALVAALVGAGIAIGVVMLWEPWDDDNYEGFTEEELADLEAAGSPAFTEEEAISLTQRHIAQTASEWPSEMKYVGCVSAEYRSANHNWVVTCEFRVRTSQTKPEKVRIYVFDDDTGQVR